MQSLIAPVKDLSASRGNKILVRVECFIEMINYYLKITNMFRKYLKNKYARVIGHQNNTAVRTGEEAGVAAEICDGAIQSSSSTT